VREHGSRSENLRNARHHCEAALGLRTPQGDREEWADSELVLSDILQGLVRLGEATPAEAEAAAQRILENAADLFDSGYPIARVQAGLADAQLTDAAIAEQEGDAHRRIRALTAAEEHMGRAMAAIDGEGDQRPLLGRLLARRAEVFDGLGRPDAAIEAGTRALEILRPESDAGQCRQAAFTLGSLLATRREWPAARAAFEDGLCAASLAFHARLDTAKREQELERRGNLHRWAAFAIARSGDLERAAVVLEDGRAHELRRRLEPGEGGDALAGLPDVLADTYRRARAALAAAPLGDPSIAPSRALQEALTAIRRHPGLSDFGMAATLAQVGSAARPSVPLIFVNPTPFGTLLLAVCEDGHGPSVRAEFAEAPSSHAVMERMMFGDLSSTDPVSFVLRATGLAFDEDGEPIDRMADALDQLLPWLGEHVARPLGDLLSDLGAAGATVVPCGLIALAPLHAASWTADGRLVRLLDRHEVSFAPSATVHAGCLQRAAIDRGQPRLVAVGDPVVEPRLEAARAEVTEIAEHFAYAEVAVDSEATSGFVLGRAPGATHVHLACHGEGGVDDFEQTRIHLTDRPVTASELAASKVLDARLTVASACQTAISEQVRFPDEALSLGTALVAGGSACVIASLWPVCDLATALLMTRLYDELLAGDVGEPVQALRRAQLWLRDLSGDAEQHFLDEHPSLAAEFRRRRSRGDAPHARSNRYATGAGSSPAAGPYAHPGLWAAFVALGA
jgi:tetratricopeptide (TPR) repeat protein